MAFSTKYVNLYSVEMPQSGIELQIRKQYWYLQIYEREKMSLVS